ncbi:MAG TPA: helix-turn-helix domain-containing GNAT family N-acetyltransferase [Devosia sp.]
MDNQIADVRAFSRFYTRQIGLLEEHFNKSRFSLPEGRVLYEIASHGHTTLAEIARALGMDPGYASRLLHKFVAEGLAVLSPNLNDRRSNSIALTSEGDLAFAQLDAASNSAVGELLRPLDDTQRKALVGAMRTIRSLLGDTVPAAPLVIRPHRIGEIGWMVHRQGILYNQQYGWNGEFEALIARIYYEYETAPETPPKNLWVAERSGTVAGSIFVMPSEGVPGSAQLRMLYVEPDARGLGIGRTLVDQAVSFARNSGYERMRLWTHSIQESARRVYKAAGFEIAESEPHHQFGKDLIAEIWEMRF